MCEYPAEAKFTRLMPVIRIRSFFGPSGLPHEPSGFWCRASQSKVGGKTTTSDMASVLDEPTRRRAKATPVTATPAVITARWMIFQVESVITGGDAIYMPKAVFYGCIKPISSQRKTLLLMD
jgi:hypothetical protein